MTRDASNLTPNQLVVLEVFRRLHQVHLPAPTLPTVAQLSKLRPSAVRVTCEQLAAMGRLQRGGASRSSYALADEERESLEAVAAA